jgi:Uma2 family endonuclease
MIVDAPTMQVALPPRRFEFRPAEALSEEEFFQLCQRNRDLRLERTPNGMIIVMPPTGFTLPDGGTRSPDAAWVRRERVYVFRPEQPRTTLDAPTTLDGAPVLPGFALKLAPIWNPDL